MKTKWIILIPLFLVLSGCASIVSKSVWLVTINTNPSGAKVEITDVQGKIVYSGISPAYTHLSSSKSYFVKQSYLVKISMNGYNERIIPIECRLNGWYFGNFAFGGFAIFGFLVVDPITGAVFRLDKDFIYETLDKNTKTDTQALSVVAIQDIPDTWKEHLVPVD